MNSEEFRSKKGSLQGLAYVAQDGNKVLVVIDDSMEVLTTEKVLNAHQTGLLEIRNNCELISEIRAVGFFTLPRPNDLKEVELVAERVHSWITQFKDHHCNVYMWVDYFYGEGFDATQNSGSAFVAYWQDQYPQAVHKIAFLSLGGKSNVHASGFNSSEHPYEAQKPRNNIKVFRKTEFEDYGFLAKHRTWLDLYEHPLETLWRNSENWFINDDEVDDTGRPFYMRHNPGKICEYFLGQTQSREKKNAYRRLLVDAFGFKFPRSWWENEASITGIHESLKHLCGVHFCGQAENSSIPDLSRRHISVGATLLLAMTAHQHVHTDIGAFDVPGLWEDSAQANLPIFPLQDKMTARKSAIALYECFKKLFEQKRLDGASESPVKAVLFEKEGKKLTIQLAWNARQKHIHDEQNLAEVLNQLISDGAEKPLNLPRVEEQAKTRFAVLDLLRYLMISEQGFGSPGSVYMDGNKLIIASTL